MGIDWQEIDPARFVAEHPLIPGRWSDARGRALRSGMLFPSRIVTDMVVHLAAMGVALHPHTKVEDIDFETPCHGPGGTVHQATMSSSQPRPGEPAAARHGGRNSCPIRQTALLLFPRPPPELAALWAEAPIYLDLDAETGTYVLPPRPARGSRSATTASRARAIRTHRASLQRTKSQT